MNKIVLLLGIFLVGISGTKALYALRSGKAIRFSSILLKLLMIYSKAMKNDFGMQSDDGSSFKKRIIMPSVKKFPVNMKVKHEKPIDENPDENDASYESRATYWVLLRNFKF